ncbi:hypothetical protein R0K05_17235, partial [Planococcus sp. SIMBA_160]
EQSRIDACKNDARKRDEVVRASDMFIQVSTMLTLAQAAHALQEKRRELAASAPLGVSELFENHAAHVMLHMELAAHGENGLPLCEGMREAREHAEGGDKPANVFELDLESVQSRDDLPSEMPEEVKGRVMEMVKERNAVNGSNPPETPGGFGVRGGEA